MRKRTVLAPEVFLLAFAFLTSTVMAQECKGPYKSTIVRLIHDKYVDPANPDFSFVHHEVPEDVTRLLTALKDHDAVNFVNRTDPRTDLSYVFGLEGAAKKWRLAISMVGKYATLFRLGTQGRSWLITEKSPLSWPKERAIVRALTEKHYTLLPQATLKCKSPLARLQNMESGDTITLWHALFRDEPGLPF